MENGLFILIGMVSAAAITALSTYVISMVTSQNQLALQSNEHINERLKAEIKLEREKLEKLHKILSKIRTENSKTLSYIKATNSVNLDKYRDRYLANCDRAHEGLAIIEIYYPTMKSEFVKVYALTNVFWGYQEKLMQIDIKDNQQGWENNLAELYKAEEKLSLFVKQLHFDIADRVMELNDIVMRIPINNYKVD